MAEPILLFDAVSLRSLEERTIFAGLTWSLPRGMCVVLRCGSGSIATTLLHLAAGLIQPEEGHVILDGFPLHAQAFDHPFLKRGALGWLPTEGGLIENLSLLGNVTLPLCFVKGLRIQDAESLAMEVLATVGLHHLASLRPHGLELRERWLGAVVRAALMEPELWLVDRPPGDLDTATKEAARHLLTTSLNKPGTSALLIWDEWDHLALPTQFVKLEGGKILPED